LTRFKKYGQEGFIGPWVQRKNILGPREEKSWAILTLTINFDSSLAVTVYKVMLRFRMRPEHETLSSSETFGRTDWMGETERRSRVVGMPASYLGVPVFEFRSGD
jgi:hypothetical protein